jgi:glycosyltransferase involved in cell wall biosynthesis
MNPEITAIVPTHNRKGLLATTLRTVLWQQDVQLETIVVDDGSSEDTEAVVMKLGDSRVRLIRHETPQGVCIARNRGAAEARADWLAFCDDDDLWAPDKLARQLDAARAAGRDWAYAGAVGVDDRHRVLHVEPPITPAEVMRQLPRRNVVPAGASNVAVRAAALAAAGPFDTRLHGTEDWDLFIRLARRGPPAAVQAPLVAVRLHEQQSSLETARLLEDLDVLERRYGVPVDRPAIHRGAAWACLRAGRRREALVGYVHAVRAGDLGSVARAAVTLLPGRARERLLRGRTAHGDGPAADLLQAQAWVDELVRG